MRYRLNKGCFQLPNEITIGPTARHRTVGTDRLSSALWAPMSDGC